MQNAFFSLSNICGDHILIAECLGPLRCCASRKYQQSSVKHIHHSLQTDDSQRVFKGSIWKVGSRIKSGHKTWILSLTSLNIIAAKLYKICMLHILILVNTGKFKSGLRMKKDHFRTWDFFSTVSFQYCYLCDFYLLCMSMLEVVLIATQNYVTPIQKA